MSERLEIAGSQRAHRRGGTGVVRQPRQDPERGDPARPFTQVGAHSVVRDHRPSPAVLVAPDKSKGSPPAGRLAVRESSSAGFGQALRAILGQGADVDLTGVAHLDGVELIAANDMDTCWASRSRWPGATWWSPGGAGWTPGPWPASCPHPRPRRRRPPIRRRDLREQSG